MSISQCFGYAHTSPWQPGKHVCAFKQPTADKAPPPLAAAPNTACFLKLPPISHLRDSANLNNPFTTQQVVNSHQGLAGLYRDLGGLSVGT